jgi:hypothetical protein
MAQTGQEITSGAQRTLKVLCPTLWKEKTIRFEIDSHSWKFLTLGTTCDVKLKGKWRPHVFPSSFSGGTDSRSTKSKVFARMFQSPLSGCRVSEPRPRRTSTFLHGPRDELERNIRGQYETVISGSPEWAGTNRNFDPDTFDLNLPM